MNYYGAKLKYARYKRLNKELLNSKGLRRIYLKILIWLD